jgi:hypothetical protein
MYLTTNFMNKIMLFLLICTGLVAIVPMSAKALAPQIVSQNLHGETNLLIAQDRDNRNRQRQFTVYYRSPRDRQWTLEGPHPDRRDAERAARRLERRGYKTYVQVSREAHRGMMDRDRGIMDRDMQRR